MSGAGGKSVKADLLWHLRDGGDIPARLTELLAPCKVLTPEEAATVTRWLDGATPKRIRALLSTDEAGDEIWDETLMDGLHDA